MVAVVNQAFVKKFFPKEDPIGRHFGNFDQKYAADYEIVGVVADAKYNNPRDDYRPMYFRPLTQYNRGFKDHRWPSRKAGRSFPNSITVQFQGARLHWNRRRGARLAEHQSGPHHDRFQVARLSGRR